MDVLDINNMTEYYLVMDNATIHTSAAIRALVENRGYKCLYLSPFSPLLKPIENFGQR
jgi:transposase